MKLMPENNRDEVGASGVVSFIASHTIQNPDFCLTRVGLVVNVKGALSPQAEKSRMLALFACCVVLLFAISGRFPRKVTSIEMPAIDIERYFSSGWENDDAGSFVWVLNQKNMFVIANNQNVKIIGHLVIRIVGAPCGGSHQVLITSNSVAAERVEVRASQNSDAQIPITLNPYARVPVYVDVSGEGCIPSETDIRLIKVQVRQPVFIAN